MVIGSSELILNEDGSIYHLGLKSGDISDHIITVGDPDRVEMITKHFEKIEKTVHRREFKTVTGKYKGQRLTVISTGIGTDNIDIVLNELDALANIDFKSRIKRQHHKKLFIYRIGTSGSIHKYIPVDSFLCSDQAIGLDGLIHFYDYKANGEEQSLMNVLIEEQIEFQDTYRPYTASSSQTLRKLFEDNFQHGTTITANGFYGPQGREIKLNTKFRTHLDNIMSFESGGFKVTNLEMETAGIYGLSRLLGHEAISLNAILANRVDQTFSKTPQETVETLIEKTLEIILAFAKA